MEIKVGDVVRIVSKAGSTPVEVEGKLIKTTDMYSDVQMVINGQERMRRVMNHYIIYIEKVISQ